MSAPIDLSAEAQRRHTVLEEARKVLDMEARGIEHVKSQLDDIFVKVVDTLFACRGRIIVTGIGKSGLIGRKIASTLASTGTPALFLHPAEGVHGDLGVIMRHDVVLALSNSGESEEIIQLLPTIKRFGVTLIAITGSKESTLGRRSDFVLQVKITEEACPLGLAPTTSSTAMLALGDALAITLLNRRNFQPEDFAVLHPGGRLARSLLVRVEDIMKTGKDIPLVTASTRMKDVILEMTTKKRGCTAVVDDSGKLVGIITDQDIRRALEQHEDGFLATRADAVMAKHPKTIQGDELVARAIRMTEIHSISTLLVVDEHQRPIGIVHLHDLLKASA